MVCTFFGFLLYLYPAKEKQSPVSTHTHIAKYDKSDIVPWITNRMG